MENFIYKKDGYKNYLTFSLNNDFKLECGKNFGPITICFETYGKLNEDKSNCLIVTHALTGDSHLAKHHKDDSLGWWEDFVGPNKIFDTNKYFIICSNVLGGCSGSTGPSSINPDTGKPYGMSFPIITIRDMVNAQKKIFEYLKIEHILSVIGGSMGGLQALQWGISYPDFMDGVINLASPLNLSTTAIAINNIMRKAIIWDPNWNNGNYYNSEVPFNGLSIARMLGMLTYQTGDLLHQKFGRKTKTPTENFFYDINAEFEIESYLSYQGKKLVDRFDANSYLYLTRALDLFDLKESYGSYENTLGKIRAKFLLGAITSDTLFKLNELRINRDILKLNNVNLEYFEIESKYGHDSFLIEVEKYKHVIEDFLLNIENNQNLLTDNPKQSLI